MSWFQDPTLFLINRNDREMSSQISGFSVCRWRHKKELSGPIVDYDLEDFGDLSDCLGDNHQESDFDDLLAYHYKGGGIYRYVNCEGLVIKQEINYRSADPDTYTWSREPLDSPFYNIPGLPVDFVKEALEKRVSDLESRNSTLEADVQRGKDEKQDLEKQVSELTTKLKECWGGAKPWKRINNWVPFEDLHVLEFSNNTPLKIIKAPGILKLVEDDTTNVQASFFYGGLYPIVAVDVEELIPDKDEARFDPEIWGLYNNDGKHYAARKLFESEM